MWVVSLHVLAIVKKDAMNIVEQCPQKIIEHLLSIYPGVIQLGLETEIVPIF